MADVLQDDGAGSLVEHVHTGNQVEGAAFEFAGKVGEVEMFGRGRVLCVEERGDGDGVFATGDFEELLREEAATATEF